MTSSNGNIFRVTGPLCWEFTGPGEFPTRRPVTRSFDVFFDMRLNKRLSKQPWGWWFETPLWPSWRQCNVRPPVSFYHSCLINLGVDKPNVLIQNSIMESNISTMVMVVSTYVPTNMGRLFKLQYPCWWILKVSGIRTGPNIWTPI